MKMRFNVEKLKQNMCIVNVLIYILHRFIPSTAFVNTYVSMYVSMYLCKLLDHMYVCLFLNAVFATIMLICMYA